MTIKHKNRAIDLAIRRLLRAYAHRGYGVIDEIEALRSAFLLRSGNERMHDSARHNKPPAGEKSGKHPKAR